jgi:hypothetical protein
MDFRFIAAGIMAGAIGFVGGSTVFADTTRPADPTIAGLAGERQAAEAAAAVVPPAAKLPALPKPAKEPVIPAPKIRHVFVVRRVTHTAKRTVRKKTNAAPKRKQPATHEKETHKDDHPDEHQTEPQDDHAGGGDD